jgi:hypothetical protein
MIKYLTLIILAVIAINTYGQKSMDFAPKSLYAELSKKHGISSARLYELKIAQQANPLLMGKFFKILGGESNSPLYLYIGRVNSCRTGGCSGQPSNLPLGHSEYFDYFIIFDSTVTVINVKVFNYQATHGHEITAKGWLKQFIGYTAKANLEVGKTVDSISGATISANGITNNIQLVTAALEKQVVKQ